MTWDRPDNRPTYPPPPGVVAVENPELARVIGAELGQVITEDPTGRPAYRRAVEIILDLEIDHGEDPPAPV